MGHCGHRGRARTKRRDGGAARARREPAPRGVSREPGRPLGDAVGRVGRARSAGSAVWAGWLGPARARGSGVRGSPPAAPGRRADGVSKVTLRTPTVSGGGGNTVLVSRLTTTCQPLDQHLSAARGGFLPRRDEELREPLLRRQGSQVSMSVARGSASWLSSHGRGLPGESQGRGSLVGCRLWGRTESDTTEAT